MINLDYRSRTTIYEQIVSKIERYVPLGILKEKDKIMSIRELARTLNSYLKDIEKTIKKLGELGLTKQEITNKLING